MQEIPLVGNPAVSLLHFLATLRNSESARLKLILRDAPSPIDDDHLTGNECRLGKKHHGVVNVSRRAASMQWRAADEILCKFRRIARKRNCAWSDRVHRYFGGEGAREAASQHDDTRLGYAVMRVGRPS